MIVLAEIRDKMSTVPGLWGFMACVSVPLVAIAIIHRKGALAMLPVAAAVTGLYGWLAYHQAFLEGSFSQAIWSELGVVWVVNSVASACVPLCAVTAVVLLRPWPIPAGRCRQCGYKLRGNPDADACPECGERIEPARVETDE